MWTKTGRRIAYGKQFGGWLAKQHRSKNMEPRSLVYNDRIEIMNGVSSDQEGYWIKEELSLLQPSDRKENLYNGVPKMYANKSVLNNPEYKEVIERAIQMTLPFEGNVTILDDDTLFVEKKKVDILFIMIMFILISFMFSIMFN
jgi:hypothetical protein